MVALRPFDADGNFVGTVERAGLRRAAVRGAGFTIGGAGVSLLLQIASTVVLARILTPKDFGLVAMVTTFSLLVGNLTLNGLTDSILQHPVMTRALASNLFWVTAAIGVITAGAFGAAGHLLAALYREPLVAGVAVGMAPPIALASFSYTHLALLRRALRFGVVTGITLAGRAAMVATAIALAFWGWGYWALVAGTAAQWLATCAAAWWACTWRPSLPRPTPGTGKCVWFALHVYSHFSLSYAASNSDNGLVGWRFGASALGFYKKAYDLFALPTSQLVSPLNGVVIATLSRLIDHPDEFRRYFLRSVATLAFLGLAVGADFAIVGREIIRIVLGPGWGEAGRIFSFFGPGVGVMLIYNTHGWLHLSVGRPDRWVRWGIVELAVTLSLFAAGLRLGPAGVALAWTVSFFVLLAPAFWYAGKPVNLGARQVLSAIWPFFLASSIAAPASALLAHHAEAFASGAGLLAAFGRACLGTAIFTSLYVAGVIALHRGLGPFRQVAGLLRELRPRQTTAAAAVPQEAHS